MATSEQREATRKEVSELLTSMVNISPSDFARADLGDSLSFQESVSDLALMIEPLQELAVRDLGHLSFQQLERIKKAAGIVRERTDEISNFDLATLTGAPMEARNQILQRLQEAPDQVLELLSLPLALTNAQTINWAEYTSEIETYRETMREAAEASQGALSRYQAEASTALTAIKNIAGEAGVAEHATYFETASMTHAGTAKTWLRATIAAAAVTFVVAIGFLLMAFYWVPETVPQTIQYTIAKLIILSVLSFATVWAASNYRAARHNELVNGHRRDALGTFRAFVEASEDPQVRDAILLQAAQAIFVGRTTGFDSDEAAPTMAVPLMEMIKHVGSAQSGSS